MIGLLCLATGLLGVLCLLSYHVQDGSWNTAAGAARPLNLTGRIGSHAADIALQVFGSAAFLLPLIALALGWKWVRSEPIEAPLIKGAGWLLLLVTVCAGTSLIPNWRLFGGVILPGGGIGSLVAEWMKSALNLAGTAIVLATALIVSVYVISSFSLSRVPAWLTWPYRAVSNLITRAKQRLKEKAVQRQQAALERRARKNQQPEPTPGSKRRRSVVESEVTVTDDPETAVFDEIPVVELPVAPLPGYSEGVAEIPIRPLDEIERDTAPWSTGPAHPVRVPAPEPVSAHHSYRLPPTTLLNDPEPRSLFDEKELKTTAALIKAKFEEFNVLGSVVQINPGPVVTTFEFKPEAGIKY